ncbi:hypothetical protein FRC17_001147, partial [Serendipita sp. 399]
MALVSGYSSDENDGEELSNNPFGIKSSTANPSKRMKLDGPSLKVVAAPSVLSEVVKVFLQIKAVAHEIARPTDTQMLVNITHEDMVKPILGPENPFAEKKAVYNQNMLSGHVEELAIDEHAFRQQHLTHAILGYSVNPSEDPNAARIVGSMEAGRAHNFATLDAVRPTKAERKDKKRKRDEKGDLEVVDGEGAYQGPWAKWEGDDAPPELPEGWDENAEPEPEPEETSIVPNTSKRRMPKVGPGNESTIFHGKSLTDYQGRTYMHPPYSVAPQLSQETGSQETFIPKKCIHTWTGHTAGVSVIRLFPNTSHLLLSGSMDNKIKLWDVYNEGNCLRTFLGHGRAVKDVTFSNDGRRFLSCGFDRFIKLWDTETGKCIKNFSNGKMAHVLRFHPDEDKQNIFLAGMTDKKIIQYDIDSGEITQEYDQHLGPVNSITFVDENRRFVTTSDDKTIRAWDFDIPVVIKYIAEPYMHSMPAVTLHPN